MPSQSPARRRRRALSGGAGRRRRPSADERGARCDPAAGRSGWRRDTRRQRRQPLRLCQRNRETCLRVSASRPPARGPRRAANAGRAGRRRLAFAVTRRAGIDRQVDGRNAQRASTVGARHFGGRHDRAAHGAHRSDNLRQPLQSVTPNSRGQFCRGDPQRLGPPCELPYNIVTFRSGRADLSKIEDS